MSSKPKSATLTLDFMGISEDFKVDKDTTTQDLLDQAVTRFHLEKSNKTFDVFAVNIADNSELFSLRAAPFKPFELHLELESTVGKGKFEYSYHPVEATEIKQQKTQETNLKKSRSGRKEKNKSLKKHSSNNLRERSLSVGDIIEASLATKSTNKSPSRPLSSRSSRRRHGSLKQSSERRHRSSKKENDDDEAAPAAFVSLRSPRNADDEETNDSGFVHTLDKAQIKQITDKQYPKLINAPVTYAYRDDIEEWKTNKKLRKLYDDAVRKFNESGAKTTIEFLTEKKCGSDEDITQFLHECPQLEKGKVGDFLTNDNDEKSKSARVRKLFCEAIEMKDIDVLQALRRAISLLRIPGDAARLTRYLEAFADAYCKANPKSIKKPDNCFELAFVMLTLNTATHHPSAQARITDEKFQSMLANVVKGEKRLTKDDVSAYYDSIVTDEIRMPSEGLFLNVVRRGWVEVQETGGMFNKQNWRKRWAVLADNVFYLMKEPLDPPHWVIPLRDVLAMAGTVAGREHAFTLQPSEGDMIDFSEKEPEKGATAKRMASLSFAVPTKEDALRWVTSINESIDENRILVPDDDTQIISPRGTSSSHSSSRRRHSRRAK